MKPRFISLFRRFSPLCVGAGGRKARRLPRILRYLGSFLNTGAASVHLARHLQRLEILSHVFIHSRRTPWLFAHSSTAAGKLGRVGLNGPVTTGGCAHKAVVSQSASRPRPLHLARVLYRARFYLLTSRMFTSRRFGASCSIPARLKFNTGSRVSRYKSNRKIAYNNGIRSASRFIR